MGEGIRGPTGHTRLRMAHQFEWFEQHGMQPSILPLGFLEHHGEEFALLEFGLGAERMAGVAGQAHNTSAEEPVDFQ
jgi:hypothetical protein